MIEAAQDARARRQVFSSRALPSLSLSLSLSLKYRAGWDNAEHIAKRGPCYHWQRNRWRKCFHLPYNTFTTWYLRVKKASFSIKAGHTLLPIKIMGHSTTYIVSLFSLHRVLREARVIKVHEALRWDCEVFLVMYNCHLINLTMKNHRSVWFCWLHMCVCVCVCVCVLCVCVLIWSHILC